MPRAIAAGSITSTPLNRVVRVKVAMDQHEAIENHVAADTETNPSVYVPTLQLTEGQPPPIAANGGLSYMSFDRDGDAGTAAAIEAALDQIAEGHAQAFIERIEHAPPGPIETKWGLGFRGYEECLDWPCQVNQIHSETSINCRWLFYAISMA